MKLSIVLIGLSIYEIHYHGLVGPSVFKGDLDYHIVRVSMVIMYLFFGYQRWFNYEARVLIPYFGNGPLISWIYPVFGIRGTNWLLGASEWTFCVLLFVGFWSREVGAIGALGSIVTFVCTVTIIPFVPNGWVDLAGGVPAMVDNVPFLMKDGKRSIDHAPQRLGAAGSAHGVSAA